MEDRQNPKEFKIEIALDDEIAQGVYSNLALINHNENEFIIDFIFVQPQQPKARVRSRVITSPKHIKRFAIALNENIAKYEARFGTIEIGNPSHDPANYQ
ncbi:MAG: DUF3467 domain-containing protein [Deltaproteobacteria bacterium]|nr:DUF3467 domain-containing protein [Deltaproteobacteria bacterium]